MNENSLKQKQIGIVGLGLIGGSLALSLSSCGLEIIGLDSDLSQIPTNHPFKKLSNNFADLNECDFIFICTPLRQIVSTLEKIPPYLKEGSIITDVGSVKSFICDTAIKKMRKDCYFIGGHPMAGTEKSGFDNAFPELFKNKPWVLMENNSLEAKRLEEVIQLTGAQIIYANPQEHDKAAALISHLPLLLSIKLLNTLQNHRDLEVKNLATKMASSGFESMTRLAKGNPVLNKDLLELNSDNLQIVLNEYIQSLAEHDSKKGIN